MPNHVVELREILWNYVQIKFPEKKKIIELLRDSQKTIVILIERKANMFPEAIVKVSLVS